MSVTFGLFSDLHSSLPGASQRGHSDRTLADMRQGLKRFADQGIDFAVNLGDSVQPAESVEAEYNQLASMKEEWEACPFPIYNAFGNHEFSQLSYEQIKTLFHTDCIYGAFEKNGIRFLIVDTCYRPDSVHYSEDNYDWRYAILPDEQVQWLKKQLAVKKRTVILTHVPLFFDPAKDEYGIFQIQNHEEICQILTESGCVEAVFQGHVHTYSRSEYGGIPFINIPSPERSEEYAVTDFPIVTIDDTGITMNGESL